MAASSLDLGLWPSSSSTVFQQAHQAPRTPSLRPSGAIARSLQRECWTNDEDGVEGSPISSSGRQQGTATEQRNSLDLDPQKTQRAPAITSLVNAYKAGALSSEG